MKNQESRIVVLEPQKRSAEVLEFESRLRQKIVGQDKAVSEIVGIYQTMSVGMSPLGRPIANLLFLGPTGSGKTRMVEAVAGILFGTPEASVKVDCAEYQHSHEISKLIGSPPGYLGHRDTPPVITQERLDRFHNEKQKLSILLFDEIEKASKALWDLLLGILDKATLTLGDNRIVDLSRTIVFMTSNLGAAEMERLAKGGIGFAPKPATEQLADFHRGIHRVAVEAAKRKFSPEFMNRIDKVVVFDTLTRKDLEEILDIELAQVQNRILYSRPERVFIFHCTAKAKGFLIDEGTDLVYGARHLKRAIERHLVFPLSSLMASEQVQASDGVTVDLAANGQSLAFTKEEGKMYWEKEETPFAEDKEIKSKGLTHWFGAGR